MKRLLELALIGLVSTPFPTLASTPMNTDQHSSLTKIEFNLEQIDPNGLVGPADGKRSLRYEFCIPTGGHYFTQVREIDSSIELYPKSRGRIICGADQVLCIGETHKPNWREVLMAIAQLDYVEKIIESHAE